MKIPEFDVYLSYAYEDRNHVRMLVQELESTGLKIWWQDQPVSGEESIAMLKKEINPQRALLAVWSNHSAGSGRVQAEARVAAEYNRLISTRNEQVIPPRGTDSVAYADLSHWFGGDSHDGIQKVFNALWALTGKGKSFDIAPPIPTGNSGGYDPVAQLSEKEKDERAWQISMRYNNKTYYEYYLNRFPNGIHRAEAEAGIEKKKKTGKIILGVAVGLMVLYWVVYFSFIMVAY